MKLIVGLGNPGKKYQTTRHNIGFVVLDMLGRELDIPITKVKFKSYVGEGFYQGEKVVLLKPQTFMNLSGEALMAAINYYDLALEDVMVVYDDIDIEVGKLRIRKKGSGGSHNGMRNIIYLLQEDTFARLRFGVGKPGRQDLASYVLSTFPKEEIPLIKEVADKSVQALKDYIVHGIDTAMNKYNG